MIATIVMVLIAIVFFAALAWVASIILVPVLGVLIGIPMGLIQRRILKKRGLLPPWPGHPPTGEDK